MTLQQSLPAHNVASGMINFLNLHHVGARFVFVHVGLSLFFALSECVATEEDGAHVSRRLVDVGLERHAAVERIRLEDKDDGLPEGDGAAQLADAIL